MYIRNTYFVERALVPFKKRVCEPQPIGPMGPFGPIGPNGTLAQMGQWAQLGPGHNSANGPKSVPGPNWPMSPNRSQAQWPKWGNGRKGVQMGQLSVSGGGAQPSVNGWVGPTDTFQNPV